MFSFSQIVSPSFLAVVSLAKSIRSRSGVRLALLCLVFTLTLGGAWGASFAQTAHFVGVESVVASSGLSSPHQVAVDSNGAVYFADTGNNRVLKETASGGGYQQSIIAATGLKTPAGVAVDASGNVYIVDSGNNRVLKEKPSSGSYSQSVIPISGLSDPSGIAVDKSGNLYISDYGNARVIKETLVGSNYSQSLVVGGFGADGVAVDSNGDVYVCAVSNDEVIKMTPKGSGYSLSFVASGLSAPHGVVVGASGVIYIAESGDSQIVRETPSDAGYNRSVVISTGAVKPQAIALDSNQNLYFNDPTGGKILKLSQGGVNLGTLAVGTPSKPNSLIFSFDATGTISAPSVVTTGIAGLDYTDAGTGSCTTNGTSHTYSVGDSCTVDVVFTPKHPGARIGAVELLNTAGNVLVTSYLQGAGMGPQVSFLPDSQIALPLTSLLNPWGIAVDAAGSIFLTEAVTAYSSENAVVKESSSGSGYTQTTVAIGLAYPRGVAVDGAGNVYIADQDASSILVATPSRSGYVLNTLFPDVGTVLTVAVDANGNVYFTSDALGLVKETFLGGSLGYLQSTIDRTGYYNEIAVDAAGNIYMNSPSTQYAALKETLANGTYTLSQIGSGSPHGWGLAVDGNGNVYVEGSNGVLKETLSGSSYTESLIPAPAVDGGGGLAVDANGNIYGTGAEGNTVWKADLADPPVLHFAATAVGHTSTNSPQTATIQNTGNAMLDFPIPGTGNNPSLSSGFALRDNEVSDCPVVSASSGAPGTLAPGASCNLAVRRRP